MVKTVVNRLFARLGYQVTRCGSIPVGEDAFQVMQRLVRGNTPIIFDVGAHYGETSLSFRKSFPSAAIYAFEPFAESYRELAKNTAVHSAIQTFNFGFSDTEGPKLFSNNISSATNSLLETDSRGSDTWGKGLLETTSRISLPFSTIDQFVASHSLPSIDILKLDVQGAEHLVLKGAEQTIRASRVGLIYSEVITQPTYQHQKALHEVLEMYHDYGFRLHNIFDLQTTAGGALRQIDVIFRNAAAE